jgi:hypothetical protein
MDYINKHIRHRNKMICKPPVSIFFSMLFLLTCISPRIPLIPPVEEWRTFDYGKTGLNSKTFKIKYPPFMKYRHDLGVDTALGSFIGPGIIVHYDFGWNNGHSKGTGDTLGGYAVKISRYSYEGKFCADTYFNYFYPPVGLLLTATCTTQEALDLAIRIFDTIVIYESR